MLRRQFFSTTTRASSNVDMSCMQQSCCFRGPGSRRVRMSSHCGASAANYNCRYVDNILKSTGEDVEQVAIEPNGKWSLNCDSESPPGANGTSSATDEDEDIVEIKGSRVSLLKDQTPHTSNNSQNLSATPLSTSREPSTASGGVRSTNKRPISQVIDLTFSDEDDDEPPRPAKRQFANCGMNDSRYEAFPSDVRSNGASPVTPTYMSLGASDQQYRYRER